MKAPYHTAQQVVKHRLPGLQNPPNNQSCIRVFITLVE